MADLTTAQVQAIVDALADAPGDNKAARTEKAALRAEEVKLRQQLRTIHSDDHVKFWSLVRNWGSGSPMLVKFVAATLRLHEVGERNAGLIRRMASFDQPGPSLLAYPSAVSRDETVSDHTGAPGRPSSMHLITDELERRIEAKEELEDKVSGQARVLRSWFINKHPGLARPKERTIENAIREIYRKARASRMK